MAAQDVEEGARRAAKATSGTSFRSRSRTIRRRRRARRGTAAVYRSGIEDPRVEVGSVPRGSEASKAERLPRVVSGRFSPRSRVGRGDGPEDYETTGTKSRRVSPTQGSWEGMGTAVAIPLDSIGSGRPR